MKIQSKRLEYKGQFNMDLGNRDPMYEVSIPQRIPIAHENSKGKPCRKKMQTQY